ncbi:MAG: energy-coupling factor ABC transporter permease [Nitrososphaeria archaeon]
MHIPDGFLDAFTVVVTYAIFLAYGAYALRKAKTVFSTEHTILISVLSACIFAAQMLNWPLPGGTSLHFVGGAVAGIMLGPWLGFLSIFLVLLIQCLVFHDGGITALGANALNMAIVSVLVGFLVYKILLKAFGTENSIRFAGAFLGGWLGIVLAGAACGLEIGFSPAFPYGVAFTVPVMIVWHALLGIVEGAVTAFTVLYLVNKAPKYILSDGGVMK